MTAIFPSGEAEYYDRLYSEKSPLVGAAVQHIPPIYVHFEAEAIPPTTGFPFLDNAGAGTRTAAMDKMRRVRTLPDI